MKAQQRKKCIEARSKIPPELRKRYERQIHTYMQWMVEELDCIGVYVGYGDEVTTLPFIEYLLQENKQVAVVKCEGNTLAFYQIYSLQDLSAQTLGILEPTTKVKIELSEIEIMFIPLVGFDLKGVRLGQGKGYYDRILKDVQFDKVGVAFSVQCLDTIEAQEHDIPLDKVVSERGIYQF